MTDFKRKADLDEYLQDLTGCIKGLKNMVEV